MSARRWIAALLIVFVSCALTGSTCHKKRETKLLAEYSESLGEVARDFNKLIVWRNFMPASLMVVPSKRIDFLMDAEKYSGNLQIDSFEIVLCQVETTPPIKDLKLPGARDLEEATPPPDLGWGDTPTPTPTPTPRPMPTPAPEAAPAPTPDIMAPQNPLDNRNLTKEPGKKGEKPEIFYGTVLVRYISRSILPSATVDNKLIKQYWINVEGVWYCDFNWKEMLER